MEKRQHGRREPKDDKENQCRQLAPRLPPRLSRPLAVVSYGAPPPNVRARWDLRDFHLYETLGRGHFGTVYKARESTTGYLVALKVLKKEDIMKRGMETQLRREIEIQSELSHANILRLYGFFYDEKRIYIILEYAPGGTLYKRLEEKGVFSEKEAAGYIAGTAAALRHCHLKGVIHRDLKPENLLLDARRNVKIADFGWSVHNVRHSRRSTVCGTLDFLAPELCEERDYDFTVDIWSLGILMYEMLYGKPPFEVRKPSMSEAKDSTMKRIVEVDLRFPPKPEVSSSAKNLIRALLRKEPARRLSLTKVLTHSWIVDNSRSR